MLFVEPRFIVFFCIVWAVHWALRQGRARKVWLLAASYVFYAAWDWRFLSLIVASTVLDFIVGRCLERRCGPSGRKHLLAVSIVGNLAILGFFKYFNFFAASAADLANLLGLHVSATTLDIVLPVGISFYTFQTLSYSIDVYRGRIAATRSLLDLAVFVGFFPQLVAGPIVRAADFLPQLRERRVFSHVDFRGCLALFLVGFFKKACISDNLAPVVDQYFANPQAYTAVSAWIATVFYAVQIYCDFSGYSDMAIATAGLLGYQLCRNFDFPYLATSITDFWRRWHISLSTWLRDYLYIPLGGNRGSKLFTYRNLMITMLLGGLWHGAAWNFVVWGGLHGIALIAHKEWGRRRQPVGDDALARLLCAACTFYWVCVAWVFFRSADFPTALAVLRSFVLLESPGSRQVGMNLVWLLPCLAVVHWLTYKRFFLDRVRSMADWTFAAWYGLATSLTVALVPTHYRAFIYFQF